ncbi:MAG: ferritin [Planctomycetaceae bacterium]
MLSTELEQALNDQLNRESYSSYLYLAMAAHFDGAGFPGFAAWMRAQASEEHLHAMRFFDFIADRGGRVRLQAIAEPPVDFGTPLQAFEASLDHERFITRSIEALYDQSDRPTQAFLDWFLTEQVEEERTVSQIVESMRLAGDSGPALLLLDRELGVRPSADGAAPAQA